MNRNAPEPVILDFDLDFGSHAALTISLRSVVHAAELDELSRMFVPVLLRRLAAGFQTQKRHTFPFSLDEKTVALNALDLAVRYLDGDPSCYDPVFHLTSLPGDMAAYAQAIRTTHSILSALDRMRF